MQNTGYILKAFENHVSIIFVTIICKAGWVLNVTGFAIVLWSRLHLVVNSRKTLKVLLIMIIVNGILCHSSVIIFESGLVAGKHATFYEPMHVIERLQQVVFPLQETIISTLYIYHTARFLNIGYPMHTRKVIGLLLCVQLLVIALDAMLTVFDFIDWVILKRTLHAFVYAFKLKLEFVVLNQLQSLVTRGFTPGLGLSSQLPVVENSSTEANSSSQFVANPQTATVLPVFGRGFITKAPVATTKSLTDSPTGSATSSLDKELDKRAHAKHDSQQSFGSEEHDLRNIMGRPDSLPRDTDEVERMYLGRWEAADNMEKGSRSDEIMK
jgi:hypothetical protein